MESPERRINADLDTPESKTLKAIEQRKDSSLDGFGKMLDSFIVEAWLTPDKSKWAEWLKKEYTGKARSIMEDPTLNVAWKDSALQRLFGTFKENKEFFPTPTEQVQWDQSTQMKYEQGKDDFYEKFHKALALQDAERTMKDEARSKKIAIAWDKYTWDRYPPYGHEVAEKAEDDLNLT